MWQGRLALAQQYQDDYGNTDKRWDKNVKAMAGDFNSEQELGDEAVDVNMVRSTMRSTLPPLYITEPHITVIPTQKTYNNADNIARARYTEMELNYWFRELGVRHEVKKVVHDAEATNLGYLYVGYIKNERDNNFDYLPTARTGQPFIRRIGTKNVLVPPGYDDLEEMPWIGIEFLRPKIELVKKFGLSESQADKLPVESYFDADGASSSPPSMSSYVGSDDAMLVRVINVWDKVSETVLIIVPGYEEFLEEPRAWPYELEGFPISVYRPEHVPDEYHATPPISFYYKQNKELNATRTAMAKRRNRTKALVIVDGAVDESFDDKYKNAPDGSLIRTSMEDSEGKLNDHIMIDNGLPFDNGDLAYDAMLKSDIHDQGAGANRRGTSEPGVDSATETAEIAKGEQIREADRSDGVRNLYISVAKKLRMILIQYPKTKRTILIAGSLAGEFTEVSYTLEELKGEFDFKMDLGTALSMSPKERQNVAAINYNLFRQDPLVDPIPLIVDVFDSQQNTDPQRYLLALKSPQQEHQLMSQGLPVQANARDEHQVHLTQHMQLIEQIDDYLQRADRSTPQSEKISITQTLMIAHLQDHARILQQITGKEGQAVSTNLLRNQLRSGAGTETDAELGGQPIGQG